MITQRADRQAKAGTSNKGTSEVCTSSATGAMKNFYRAHLEKGPRDHELFLLFFAFLRRSLEGDLPELCLGACIQGAKDISEFDFAVSINH